VIVSWDVIVDERASGSEPRSEFEVSPVEAPGLRMRRIPV
jgi:hypothetical protein